MIYSFRYLGQDPKLLAEWIREHNSVVVDARLKARVRDKRWSRENLQEELGAFYVSVPHLLQPDCPPQRIALFRDLLRQYSEVVLLFSERLSNPSHLSQIIGQQITPLVIGTEENLDP